MDAYENKVFLELLSWEQKMLKRPSLANLLSKGVQDKFNQIIPDKVHEIITSAIKNMVKAVLLGSEFTTRTPLYGETLEKREALVKDKLNFYRKSAIVTGAGTGAGGFLIGLADFPILIGIKMKFLFDAASLYGFNVKDYRERLFILYIFQLAFCSDEKRIETFKTIRNWNQNIKEFPDSIDLFDWRVFQQEYRDYIDLSKMLQIVPFIGAPVGAFANNKLLKKLGETAMNSYRMRFLNK